MLIARDCTDGLDGKHLPPCSFGTKLIGMGAMRRYSWYIIKNKREKTVDQNVAIVLALAIEDGASWTHLLGKWLSNFMMRIQIYQKRVRQVTPRGTTVDCQSHVVIMLGTLLLGRKFRH